MTTVATTTPKPRRLWLQFSLRGFMMLVLICSVPCGWLAYELKLARDQREVVKAIRELGGSVNYGRQSGGIIRTAVAWLGKLAGEDLPSDVIDVELSNSQVTDAGLP